MDLADRAMELLVKDVWQKPSTSGFRVDPYLVWNCYHSGGEKFFLKEGLE